MKKIFTILVALLAIVGVKANIIDEPTDGQSFIIGNRITSANNVTTGTYVIVANPNDNAHLVYQNSDDGKVYISDMNAQNKITLPPTNITTSNVFNITKNENGNVSIQCLNGKYVSAGMTTKTEATYVDDSSKPGENHTTSFRLDMSGSNFLFVISGTGNNRITLNFNNNNTVLYSLLANGGWSQFALYPVAINKSHTVTWRINYNGTTTTKTTIVASGENAIAPSADYPFTTITPNNAEEVKNITEDKTIEATYTFNTPFTASTDYSSATWYYLKAGRDTHYAYYNSNSNVSTSGNKTNTKNYKWAFIGNPIDGYKVINKESGDSKFVYAANGNNNTMLSMSDAETIWQIVDGSAQAANTFTFYLNGTSGGYWNSYDNNNAIGMWQQSVTDPGSRWLVEEAETEEDVQYTVTWNIKENGSDKVITTLTTKVAQGETATLSASYPFTTLSPTEETNVTKDVTVDVTATFSTPFTASTEQETHYYFWKNANNLRYAYYDESNTNQIPLTTNNTNTAAFKWAFYGNPITGYTIKNKATGNEQNLYIQTASNTAHPTMSNQEKIWPIVSSTRTDLGETKTLFTFILNNVYVNDYSGRGILSFWQDSPNSDKGSNWRIEEAPDYDMDIAMHALGENTYATTCLPVAFNVPDGITAYKVTAAQNNDSEKGTATLTAIEGTVPAQEPVVLIGTDANQTKITLTAVTDNTTEKSNDNKLRGILTATAPNSNDYYFGKLGDAAGFYRTNVSTVKAISYKAYLPSDFAGANAASKGYAFSFGDDDVTGINSATETATTADENATRYNLQGQRVDKDAKGIIIIGGKKYIIK